MKRHMFLVELPPLDGLRGFRPNCCGKAVSARHRGSSHAFVGFYPSSGTGERLDPPGRRGRPETNGDRPLKWAGWSAAAYDIIHTPSFSAGASFGTIAVTGLAPIPDTMISHQQSMQL